MFSYSFFLHKIEITIDDFDGVVYQYLIWKGERWKRCERCKNKWFKLKSPNSNQKCCKSCANIIEIEKHKFRNKKWYKEKKKCNSDET